jgi:hypothetical protein
MLASKGEKELNENEKNWKIGKKPLRSHPTTLRE